MLHIALYAPEIAPNTGNIIRLAANAGITLHLIEPFGFELDDKKLRRAGLDYHEWATLRIHSDFAAFEAHLTQTLGPFRLFVCTARTQQTHSHAQFQTNDVFLFGPESQGLPIEIINTVPAEQRIRIPMRDNSRSLNLSNAVAIITWEALRQLNYPGML